MCGHKSEEHGCAAATDDAMDSAVAEREWRCGGREGWQRTVVEQCKHEGGGWHSRLARLAYPYFVEESSKWQFATKRGIWSGIWSGQNFGADVHSRSHFFHLVGSGADGPLQIFLAVNCREEEVTLIKQ